MSLPRRIAARARDELVHTRSAFESRRLEPADPTLRALAGALRAAPSAAELAWSPRVEARRADLESRHDAELRLPLAAGEADGWTAQIAGWQRADPAPRLDGSQLYRRVSEVTRTTSKPPAWGRLFFRLAATSTPARVLELGTSVGLSGAYWAAGLASAGSGGQLVTIEGQEAVAAVAREGFERLGLEADVVVGTFAERLPGVLTAEPYGIAFIDGHHEYAPTLEYFDAIVGHVAPGGLLVFDDVQHWEGMDRAWAEIRADERVGASLTIGDVGFAVAGPSTGEALDLAALPLR